jgi:hypothetical protein
MRILRHGLAGYCKTGVPAMCDYSLQNVTSRPAKVGDKLVTTQFNGTITRGFAAIGEPGVAVCLLPGTEVAFAKDVTWQASSFGLLVRTRTVNEKVARFRQINKQQPHVHHDALEFPNGENVLLATLCQGQHATVLQLPVQPKTAAEAEAQTRVAYVG